MKFRIKELIICFLPFLTITSVISGELWMHVYLFNRLEDGEMVDYEGFVDINRIVQNKEWIYAPFKRLSTITTKPPYPIQGQSTSGVAINCDKKIVRERGRNYVRSNNGLWSFVDFKPRENESIEGLYQFICMEWAK